MTAKVPAKPDTSDYVLGTGADETARLGLQHRLWSAAAHELWERAGIQPGQSVLDLGCGPGHATTDLAQIVGARGRVTGVDASAAYLKQLNDLARARRLDNIDRVLGDAAELSALAPALVGRVDAVYARWVLCFVNDVPAVLEQIRSLLKPGGKLVVQDYFNYEALALAPHRESFTRVIRAIGASWRAHGGDPDIVGRLPAMLRAAGFRLDYLEARQRIARPGSQMWHWPTSFWSNYLPRLVAMKFITEADRRDFEACWEDASRDPDTFILLPTVFDVIAVKE